MQASGRHTESCCQGKITGLLLFNDIGQTVNCSLWTSANTARQLLCETSNRQQKSWLPRMLYKTGRHNGRLVGTARGAGDKESPAPKFTSREPLGGPQFCSFPIQWELCPVGERHHRNLNYYCSGLQGDKYLYILAIWALRKIEQEEHLGKLDPKVITCFKRSDGALEIKMILGVTFGKNKSWATLCPTLYLDVGWSRLDYVKDLIWAVIKNAEIQKKLLQGLKK